MSSRPPCLCAWGFCHLCRRWHVLGALPRPRVGEASPGLAVPRWAACSLRHFPPLCPVSLRLLTVPPTLQFLPECLPLGRLKQTGFKLRSDSLPIL